MNDYYYFNVKRKRPEETFNEVSEYYNEQTLSKYAKSKNMMRIQEKITIRALEILELKKKRPLILDAGSGPGFAAVYLKEKGYRTIALDIISGFLYFYDIKDLNPIVADMCYSPFKYNSFDAIISISALQWIYRDLNNAFMKNKLINMAKSFYQILKPNHKVVIQFYPKSKEILESLIKIILNSTNFKGNLIIDNPNNPKKRKIFLELKKKIAFSK
ncbi:MAG: class I SAM-dependent methyltransferase [Candidatus Thorarchaeota archaeon]